MLKRLAIYLLRNDLRVHDNECLQWCHLNSEFILPVYCFDPRHFQDTWHYGLPKTGPQRTNFLRETAGDLRTNLIVKGSHLVIKQGKPETVIMDLLKAFKNSYQMTLVYQEEVTKEELDVEAALEKACKSENVAVKKIWGATLHHKDDLPFKISQTPDTYTQFRKKAEDESEVRPVIRMPEKFKPLPELPPGFDKGAVPTNLDLGVAEFTPNPKSAFPWSGGETSGLARVKYYFWDSDSVAKYKDTRNGLVGANYSTKFSAWLSIGSVSPRYIYSEIKKYEHQRVSNQSTYWVIFELLWRDYFRFVTMKYGDRVFYATGIMGKPVEWKKDIKQFEMWKNGTTGVPFVDANMRELAQTGWMSNRGRQNVASFLVKDLGLDWRMGAEWFESQLLDHDVCSNYGNWNYAAGIGNDPRENRKFNMVKQGLDYDPDGEFIRLWIPELSGIKTGKVHIPWTLSGAELGGANLGSDYPKPMVMAPEWGRHQSRAKPAENQRNNSRGGKGNQRGIDFYFKSGGSK